VSRQELHSKDVKATGERTIKILVLKKIFPSIDSSVKMSLYLRLYD